MKVDVRKLAHKEGEITTDSNNNGNKQQKQHGLVTELSFEDPLQSPNGADRPNKYGACDLRHPSLDSSCGGNDSINNSDTENKLDVEPLTKLERLAQRIPCLGIMLALGASIFLGSAGMLVKMTQSVHGIQVAVFRAMIQMIVYSTIMYMRRLPFIPDRGERWPVFGRALLGSASITFSYYALKLIPLGDATTIRFSLPIWTLIISYLILGESCDFFKIFAVIVSISGVILIAKPDDVIYAMEYILYELGCSNGKEFNFNGLMETDTIANSSNSQLIKETEEIVFGEQGLVVDKLDINKHHQIDSISKVVVYTDTHQQLIGCLLALSSSICLSMSLIALRLCKRTPAEITIWWLSCLSIIIGSITLISMGEWRLPNNWLDVAYIFLNGLCGTLGQWFITSALKVEQSGVISLARTCDIQVAFLYSAFLLHEQIRVSSIVGSIMVSGGVICCVIPKWLESRAKKRDKKVKLMKQQQQQQNMISNDDDNCNRGIKK